MAYALNFGQAPKSVSAMRGALNMGDSVIGVSLHLGSPLVAEMFAHLDLDFIYIDGQHGVISYDTMLSLVRALDRSKISVLVRVRSNDAGEIGQALDAGADGVIVPMVNSRAEAERAVAACRYGPGGIRSYGPLRTSLTRGGTVRDADSRVVCLVMVETSEGVTQVEEIAQTPGLDGIYIGQADLAVSLGLEPELRIQPGPHQEAIDRIRRACTEAGIAAGISGNPAEMCGHGFRIVTAGSDYGLLVAGLEGLAAKIKVTNRTEDRP